MLSTLHDQDWEDYVLELTFLSKSFKFQINSENCNETKPCVKQAPQPVVQVSVYPL